MTALGSRRFTDVSGRVRRVPDEEPASAELEAPRALPLSLVLERGTTEARRQAEQSVFLEALFLDTWEGIYGQFVRAQHYVSYLRELHALYTAFEGVLATLPESPLTQVLRLPELRRASALSSDLVYFRGEVADPPARAQTRMHVERLREVATEAPHLLVAHAYARCVLDLFTAPSRAPLVSNAFELEAGWGTAFYNAVLTSRELGGFRSRLHARLDELALSEGEVREVLQEARLAFRLQVLLCEDLARGMPGLCSPVTPRRPAAPPSAR